MSRTLKTSDNLWARVAVTPVRDSHVAGLLKVEEPEDGAPVVTIYVSEHLTRFRATCRALCAACLAYHFRDKHIHLLAPDLLGSIVDLNLDDRYAVLLSVFIELIDLPDEPD